MSLKASLSIGKVEKYDLIFKMVVPDTKSYLPFITFSHSYLIVDNNEIHFDKILNST